MVRDLRAPAFANPRHTLACLAEKNWFPFNEWIFSEAVHGRGFRSRDLAVIEEMRRRTWELPDSEALRRSVVRLRALAPELVAAMAEELAPFDVIGISTTFLQNLPALALAKYVKNRWPEKRVILGGANCDGEMGPALLANFPFLDFAFSGEADFRFGDFLESLTPGAEPRVIPGMHSRNPDGSPRLGPPASPIEQLDSLPIPDFEDYAAEWEIGGHSAAHSKMILALESSRGCWWGARQHCTFCGLNASGMAHRAKSAGRFLDEVAAVTSRYRTRYLYMADNILPMEFYDRFMERMRETGIRLNFFYEIKSNVRRQHVEKMAAAGVTYVQPGIESLSTRVLELMRKGVTGIQNVTYLRLAREHGILSMYSILAGFPGENPEDYAAMVRQFPRLVHLQPPMSMAEVEFHRFSPYHSHPEQFGLELRPSWHYGMLYPLEESEIARIAYIFEGAQPFGDREYLRPVIDAIRQWRAASRGGECSLTWGEDRADIVIDDRRPGFGPRRYRLRGFAAAVFRMLDEPRSLSSLVREARKAGAAESFSSFESAAGELVIEFSAAEFETSPGACMQRFEDAALVYVEDRPRSPNGLAVLGGEENPRQYVALPVPARFTPFHRGWLVP